MSLGLSKTTNDLSPTSSSATSSVVMFKVRRDSLPAAFRNTISSSTSLSPKPRSVRSARAAISKPLRSASVSPRTGVSPVAASLSAGTSVNAMPTSSTRPAAVAGRGRTVEVFITSTPIDSLFVCTRSISNNRAGRKRKSRTSAKTIAIAVSRPMSALTLKLDVNSTRKPADSTTVFTTIATPTFLNA